MRKLSIFIAICILCNNLLLDAGSITELPGWLKDTTDLLIGKRKNAVKTALNKHSNSVKSFGLVSDKFWVEDCDKDNNKIGALHVYYFVNTENLNLESDQDLDLLKKIYIRSFEGLWENLQNEEIRKFLGSDFCKANLSMGLVFCDNNYNRVEYPKPGYMRNEMDQLTIRRQTYDFNWFKYIGKDIDPYKRENLLTKGPAKLGYDHFYEWAHNNRIVVSSTNVTAIENYFEAKKRLGV